MFQTATEPNIKYLYRTKIIPPSKNEPSYYEPVIGIDKVKQGGFAYYTEKSTAYQIIAQTYNPVQICELEELSLVKPIMLSVMAQKNFQYKRLFTVR